MMWGRCHVRQIMYLCVSKQSHIGNTDFRSKPGLFMIYLEKYIEIKLIQHLIVKSPLFTPHPCAVCHCLSYGFSLVCHLPFVISVSSSDDITFSTVLQWQYASELKQTFKGAC